MTDIGLILVYIMIGIAVIVCIASPIIQIKNQPGKMKEMIMPIALLVLLFVFSILISSNEVLPSYTSTDGNLISSFTSKIVGGSLITFYLLAIIAIGTVMYSEFLKKLFKNGKK